MTHPTKIALEALNKIRRTPSMPFPDRSAHSERAFSEAVWRAWSSIQTIAREAIAALEAQTGTPSVFDDDGCNHDFLDKYAKADISIATDGLAPMVQHAIDCCNAWVPEARLIGNVMAGDLAHMLTDYYQRITTAPTMQNDTDGTPSREWVEQADVCSMCKGCGCNLCGNTGQPFNPFTDSYEDDNA